MINLSPFKSLSVICEHDSEMETYNSSTNFRETFVPFSTSTDTFDGFESGTSVSLAQDEEFSITFGDVSADDTLAEVTLFVTGSQKVQVTVEFLDGSTDSVRY